MLPNGSTACSWFPLFFRQNVNVTYKIVSFLCSLEILTNLIVFFLEIKFQNGSHLKRGLFLTYFSHFLVTREKIQTLLQHISHLHIGLFSLPNFTKIANLSCICDSWCWFFFTTFWSNQLITKWWAKFRLECLLLIFIYTNGNNGKSTVICKPWTLNGGTLRLSPIQKTPKIPAPE